MSFYWPLSNTVITASYQNVAYYRAYKMYHYGVDLIDITTNRNVFASGYGQVIYAGYDDILGNCMAVSYTDKDGKPYVMRYYHLAKIGEKSQKWVQGGKIIAEYGDTGAYVDGKHLHLEVDFDVKFWNYTPTLTGKSGPWIGSKYGANNKTMVDPISFMRTQGYNWRDTIYVNASDKR